MEIGIVLALFFGGLGIAYGAYALEQNHRRLAVLSYVFGAGCVTASIILGVLLLDPGILSTRSNNPDWFAYKYTDVWNQHFANETVRLDGRFYHNCSFNAVTFEYDGTGPFQFDPPVPEITNPKGGQTNNSIVKGAFNLFHYIGAGVTLQNSPNLDLPTEH
jgi:hypothetical protein